MSSKRVSKAETGDDAESNTSDDKAWTSIRKQISVPDLFPRPSLSQVSIISMPTVTKEIATKYHSRPLSAPTPATTAAAVTTTEPSSTKDTVSEKEASSSQVDAQGQMATKKVTSKVADKVRDILSGRVAGKVTAKIMGRKEAATEPSTSQPRSSVEVKVVKDTSAEQDVLIGKPLSSADMATLSNPRIQSYVLADYNERQRPPDFPQPFYSTLGRYKPHAPGDEAFSPITLAMTLEPDEGKRGSLKRPTLLIRRTPSTEKIPSKTSLTLPGAASPKGGGNKTEQATESETGIASSIQTGSEAESVSSSAMMQSVVSIMKFMTQTGAQARESAAKLLAVEPGVEAGGKSLPGAEAVPAGRKPPTDALAPAGSMTEDEMEALRLSVRAMVGLQRWKKRANTRLSQKAGPHVTVKSYAKSAKHNMVLQKNMEDLATQLPLPLLKTLNDEAFPILSDIFHAYERTLGKTNPLTEQAKARVESMATFIKAYDEM